MTHTIVFTEDLRHKIAEAWNDERPDWGDEQVDDYIDRLNTIGTNVLIVVNDTDDIDESIASPTQLVALAVMFYGWPSHEVEILDGAWLRADQLNEGLVVEVEGELHAVMDVIDPARLGAESTGTVWVALRNLEGDDDDGAPVMWNNTVPSDMRFPLFSVEDLAERTGA